MQTLATKLCYLSSWAELYSIYLRTKWWCFGVLLEPLVFQITARVLSKKRLDIQTISE